MTQHVTFAARCRLWAAGTALTALVAVATAGFNLSAGSATAPLCTEAPALAASIATAGVALFRAGTAPGSRGYQRSM